LRGCGGPPQRIFPSHRGALAGGRELSFEALLLLLAGRGALV
jgi:hypothetical protein